MNPHPVAERSILIVAGEPSADRYGARLVERLRTLPGNQRLQFFGTGGDQMQLAGVQLYCHVRELASIGPNEAVAILHRYYSTYRALIRACRNRKPRVALLLDFPDFNLRLAKKLKRLGIGIIYYISPQLWAWRRGRIRVVRRYVDKMLVILPFEEEFYRNHGVAAEYVGHPLLEDFAPKSQRDLFLRRLDLDPELRAVAILPGSRRKEVHYILPTLLQAAQRISRRMPAQFLISTGTSIDAVLIRGIMDSVLAGDPAAARFRVVNEDSRDLLANCDFALVKSGTSTLEATLAGVPFLVVYKISPLSWHIGRVLIRSQFVSLANLIAGEEIVPEFLQGNATPESLANAALEYLEDPEKAAKLKHRLSEIRIKLGARNASETAADAVNRYLMEGGSQ